MPHPPRKPLVVTQTSVEAFDAPPRKVTSSSKDTSVSVVKNSSLNSKPELENPSSQSNLNAPKNENSSKARPVSSGSKQKSGKDVAALDESMRGVEEQQVVQSRANSGVKRVPGSRAASKLGKHVKQGELDEPSTDEAMNPSIKSRVASRQGSRMTSRQSQRPKSQAGSRPASRLTTHRSVGASHLYYLSKICVV